MTYYPIYISPKLITKNGKLLGGKQRSHNSSNFTSNWNRRRYNDVYDNKILAFEESQNLETLSILPKVKHLWK